MVKKDFEFEFFLPFIRTEDGRTSTIAIIRLLTRQPCQGTEGKTRAIIQAVTCWVRDTVKGRACWNYSSSDLNIGDLASYESYFRRWLKTKKLPLKDLEFIWVGEVSDSMYYDRHLVEGERLDK